MRTDGYTVCSSGAGVHCYTQAKQSAGGRAWDGGRQRSCRCKTKLTVRNTGFTLLNSWMQGAHALAVAWGLVRRVAEGGVWPAGRGSSKVIVLKGIGGRVVRATPLTALGEGDVRWTNPKLLHSARQHREQAKETEQEMKTSDTRVRARKRIFSTANFTLALKTTTTKTPPPRTGRG